MAGLQRDETARKTRMVPVERQRRRRPVARQQQVERGDVRGRALVEPQGLRMRHDAPGLRRRGQLRREPEEMRLRDVRHGEIRRDLDRPVQEGDGIAPVDVERIDGLAVAVRGLGGRARKRVALSVGDRKSVVEGKSVSVRVDLGGRRTIKKKKNKQTKKTTKQKKQTNNRHICSSRKRYHKLPRNERHNQTRAYSHSRNTVTHQLTILNMNVYSVQSTH